MYFDTSAILKYFIKEKGNALVKWIVDNRVRYSLTLHTSLTALYEFKKILRDKEKRGEITDVQMRAIAAKSKIYFKEVFHIRDSKPIPGFKGLGDTDYQQLCEKYNLPIRKHSRDARHLACVINYLRCFGGKSRPRVITADRKFGKMIRAEGYDVIDPESITKNEFLSIISE